MLDLASPTNGPSTIFGDNSSAIALLTNHNIMSLRSKCIDMYHYFCLDRIRRGEMQFQYCPSILNLAYFLTKPLARPAFTAARGMTAVV